MPSRLVPEKFKAGKLRSGGANGLVVTNPKQMVAIMLSERRNEQETGHADRPKRYGCPKRRQR